MATAPFDPKTADVFTGRPTPARVGILGGTFDPVHRAHVELAARAQQQCGLDTLVFVPCHRPPHRESARASDEHRLGMLRLAAADLESVHISDFELQNPHTSYTVETLRHFRRLNGDIELIFCMGADSLASFAQWHRWEEILQLAHLAAFDRDQIMGSAIVERFRERLVSSFDQANRRVGRIMLLDALSLPVSATSIRQRLEELATSDAEQLRADILLERWLAPQVLEYIIENQVYL